MPGRSKLSELIDDIYAKMLLRLKALLQQSTSVSLTTDAAKMPTGDSYVAVTCHWISADWCLMSAVLGVSISNVSHTAEEIVSLLNELGVKYTLEDSLDAVATDNGANFVAAVADHIKRAKELAVQLFVYVSFMFHFHKITYMYISFVCLSWD